MKRREVLKSGTATGAIAVGAVSPVTASPPPGRGCALDGRDNLAYGGDGEQIINLTRRIFNSVDTGHCDPTAWAEIAYTQHIQVFDEGEQFVAIITYNGHFDAYGSDEEHHDEHQTPNDCNKTLGGDETGPFDGGLRWTFEGDFNPGDSQTHGHLGSFDHGCDGTLDCDFASSTGWMDDYFDNVDSDPLTWWGFIYHGGRDGTWVNANQPQGDCGNIE